MIIKYDCLGNLTVDKTVCANNNFALSQYANGSSTILFKAEAVEEGHTMLITHMQVTEAGKNSLYYRNYSEGTARKHWLEDNFRKVELEIKKYLSKRNYRGNVTIRIKATRTNTKFFVDRGYTTVGSYEWDGPYRTILLQKVL